MQIFGGRGEGRPIVELNFVDHLILELSIVSLVNYQRNPVVKGALPYFQFYTGVKRHDFNFLPIPEHSLVKISPLYGQSHSTLNPRKSKPMRHLPIMTNLPKISPCDFLPAHIYHLYLLPPQSRLINFLLTLSFIQHRFAHSSLTPILIMTHVSPTLERMPFSNKV